jgi:hypothetical protein
MKDQQPDAARFNTFQSKPDARSSDPQHRSVSVPGNGRVVRKSILSRQSSNADASAASFAYLPFETAHQLWLADHAAASSGERRRRLDEGGHGHAEKEMLRKVWLPAFGHLEHLHPEYEVTDFQGGARFIDLAYIRPPHRIAIEIDGYGPHLKEASRRQFCDERVRAAHLTNDGWTVIRIGYDDLKDRPRLWQQLLQQLIGKLYGHPGARDDEPFSQEQETVRLAVRLDRPIKLSDVERHFQCGYRRARKLIDNLEERGVLEKAGGGRVRIHAWKLSGK